MRLPIRKKQKLNKQDNGPVYLTIDGIKKLKKKIATLEKQMPILRAEVARTQAMGDLSENAAYQEAKSKLRRAESALLYAKEKLKNVIEIKTGTNDGIIKIGARITIKANEKELSFLITGPEEADPANGKISYLSPLGAALIGGKTGDFIKVNNIQYKIIRVE
ncbi:transcription elongation factor GreA [Candidatus Parcubacteria bacterium]|nr:MAG: transcription elongation factor GreA [Candidatus Parcubacteria bacterium]